VAVVIQGTLEIKLVLSNAEVTDELRRLMEPIKDRIHSTLLLDRLLYEPDIVDTQEMKRK
jgi:hypothetical protein